MNNNTFYRFICTALLASSAIASLYLTCQFTYQIGVQAGMFPLLFAAIGVTLDVTKTVTPALAVNTAKKSPFTALLLSLVATALIGVSVLASMSALETSVNTAKTDSREFQTIERQIKALNSEIEALSVLAATQLDANQITNSAKTRQLISEKNEQANALLSQQSNLVPDTIFTKYGDYITIGLSVLLEVVSLVMTLTLSQLRPVTHSNTSVTPSVTSPVFTQPEALSSVTVTPHIRTPELTFAAREITPTTIDSQIFADIKAAVLSGAVKPSHRGIRAQFKVGQDKIKQVLAELAETGYLVPHNKGYKLQLA
ncbi:TPA: ABC transporter C-terminal domain-containing protein, partial [Vibrio parahaemolyticus]